LHREDEANKEQQVLAQINKDLQERSRLEHEAMNDLQDASKLLRLAELCEKLGSYELAATWRRAAAGVSPRAPGETGRPR
jgi:hypothetical protein